MTKIRDTETQPLVYSDFDVARLTGISRSSLQKWRLSGEGPPWIRIGRSVRYRREDVKEWLEALPRFTSTAEADEYEVRSKI